MSGIEDFLEVYNYRPADDVSKARSASDPLPAVVVGDTVVGTGVTTSASDSNPTETSGEISAQKSDNEVSPAETAVTELSNAAKDAGFEIVEDSDEDVPETAKAEPAEEKTPAEPAEEEEPAEPAEEEPAEAEEDEEDEEDEPESSDTSNQCAWWFVVPVITGIAVVAVLNCWAKAYA